MCWQPDSRTMMRLLDEALLEFYKKWARLTREYIDGVGVGPQDWDAAFLIVIATRMPELQETAEHAEEIKLLNQTAGVFVEAAKDDARGHADPPT